MIRGTSFKKLRKAQHGDLGLLAILGGLILALGGCADPAGTPTQSVRMDAGKGAPPQGPRPDRDTTPPMGPEIAIELTLVPERAVYAPGDVVRVRVRAADQDGGQINAVDAEVSVSPSDFAEMTGPTSFEIKTEGMGAVRTCLMGTCATRPIAASTAPFVTIEEPARASFVEAQAGERVVVRGITGNLGEGAQVILNGAAVTLREDGTFETFITPRFGVNLLRAEVSDFQHVTPKAYEHAIIIAPRYLPAGPNGVNLGRTARVRLDQPLLDSGSPVDPETGTPFEVDDFAQLVQLLFIHADIRELLQSEVIVDDELLQFRVESVDFTSPDVELEIVGSGIELVARMTGLRVTTSGTVDVGGRVISLDGSLTADVAIFARIDLSHPGRVVAEIPQYDVAVTNIVGDYADEAVNGLLRGLDNQITIGARRIVEELAGTLIRVNMPALLTVGFELLMDELGALPIGIYPALPGLASADFTLQLESSSLTHRPRNSTTLELTASLEGVQAPAIDIENPGVPALLEAEWPEETGDGVGVTVSLTAFNAISYQIWRAGVFQGVPELPAVVELTIGEVEFSAHLPPVVMVPAGRRDGLEIHLAELLLDVTPMGGEGRDLYSLYITIPVTAVADGGFVGLRAAETVMAEATLIRTASGRPFGSEELATLVESALWPLLRDSLNQGLRYGIQNLVVGSEVLGTITQSVQELTFSPELSGEVVYSPSHLSFHGGVRIEGRLGQQN